jgi:hypothetical protein
MLDVHEVHADSDGPIEAELYLDMETPDVHPLIGISQLHSYHVSK